MRITFIVLLLALGNFSFLFAQKIKYNIPDGYENDISKEGYKIIVDAAIPVVAKRYTIEQVKDGTIFLKPGQEMKELNLHNVIVKCLSIKNQSSWSNVVQVHFDNLFTYFDEQKKVDPENFETIKKYLSLRIYPKAIINQRGGISSIIAKNDLEDTYTLLMLDLPGAFAPVNKDAFTIWKKDTTEIFQIAQQNVNKQAIEKVTKSFDIDNVTVEISFLGNEDYAASYALDLNNNSPELVGEWGSVVAIPNKGIVDICKISKDKPLDFVKFIQRIKPQVEKSFREHQQPISDQFFWYYKGKFTKINILTNPDGSINVISPYGLGMLMTEEKN